MRELSTQGRAACARSSSVQLEPRRSNFGIMHWASPSGHKIKTLFPVAHLIFSYILPPYLKKKQGRFDSDTVFKA